MHSIIKIFCFSTDTTSSAIRASAQNTSSHRLLIGISMGVYSEKVYRMDAKAVISSLSSGHHNSLSFLFRIPSSVCFFSSVLFLSLLERSTQCAKRSRIMRAHQIRTNDANNSIANYFSLYRRDGQAKKKRWRNARWRKTQHKRTNLEACAGFVGNFQGRHWAEKIKRYIVHVFK